VEQKVLSLNDRYASHNRQRFAGDKNCAINLVSSPGAGKTTLLVETLRRLAGRIPLAVIEGDQQTSFDADRIRQTGVPAIQINTGRGCHLDAHMVGHAVDALALPRGAALLIENVGNLVCPAQFDLGEHRRVLILSVTEGEDKPLKYPHIFRSADLMILTKSDLLPYLDFNRDRCLESARQINPQLAMLTLSAKSGAGMQAWIDWLQDCIGNYGQGAASPSPAVDCDINDLPSAQV
jgi:hydrogenase nickel incorporation protein HypB